MPVCRSAVRLPTKRFLPSFPSTCGHRAGAGAFRVFRWSPQSLPWQPVLCFPQVLDQLPGSNSAQLGGLGVRRSLPFGPSACGRRAGAGVFPAFRWYPPSSPQRWIPLFPQALPPLRLLLAGVRSARSVRPGARFPIKRSLPFHPSECGRHPGAGVFHVLRWYPRLQPVPYPHGRERLWQPRARGSAPVHSLLAPFPARGRFPVRALVSRSTISPLLR